MLRSIKQLYGKKLEASDGDIGHVKDFFFNDQKWVVRYVIVDTGKWISGRLLLLSPHAFGDLHQDGGVLLVNLTRQQIENSPPVESHKPVSRQYEEEFHRYYGWASYWDGGDLWGMGGFPGVLPLPSASAPANAADRVLKDDDPHLRSAQAIVDYAVETEDGPIGKVTDFMMDNKSWAICHLVVETGHWFSGKEIVLSPDQIDRISYDDSTVFVSTTKEAIQQAPEYHVPPLGDSYKDTRGFDDS